jgi:hypothetical protein
MNDDDRKRDRNRNRNRDRDYGHDRAARDRDLTCEELRDGLGAELALGVLPAQERAAAIAHLDRCPACREHIEQLTLAVDGLLGLLPGSEPPVGFEKRVLSRMQVSGELQRHQRRRRRLRLAAAATAIAAAFGFGGWAVGAATDGSRPASTSAAQQTLLAADFTTGGHRVGQVFAHPGSPGWIYMSVDLEDYRHQDYGDSPGGTVRDGKVSGNVSGKVTCELERTDGSTAAVGSYTLKDGHGYWGGPASVDPDTLSAARLVAADGSVLATARFDAVSR